MKKLYIGYVRCVALLAVIGITLTGCGGGGGGGGGDSTSPTVMATSISDNATGVSEATTTLDVEFSEEMEASTLTPLTFTVSGPLGTLSATVSYSGTTATLSLTPGELDYSTTYIARVSTDVEDLAGNALASNHVWSFTTQPHPDSTPPQVSSTNPANGATGIGNQNAINVVFSESLDCATVTTNSFLLNGGAVTGNVSCNGTTATFTPDPNLLFSITYNATITTNVTDLAGNPLASIYNWSFTTGTAPDTTAPQVTSTNPVNGTTGVTVNSGINATFSEAVDCSTLDTASFTLTGPLGQVTGNVNCSGDTAAFTPSADLAYDTAYTATITTAAQDLAGIALAANYDWTFTTGTAPDTRAPSVTLTTPPNDDTDVDVNNLVAAEFTEPMDPSSISTASFILTGPSGNLDGTVTYSGTTATFTNATSLDFSTNYTATVTANVMDLAGNPMTANHSWSFTTAAIPDTTPPTVLSTMPGDGDSIDINSIFTAVFSEPLDCTTVDSTSFSLSGGVTGNVICSGDTVTFTPSADLAYNTAFTATLTTAITDLAANPLAVDYTWTANTGEAPDITAPSVSSTTPSNGDLSVPINTTLSAVFDDDVDCSTVDTNSFFLENNTTGGTAVTGNVSCIGDTATFTPTSGFDHLTSYTATITTAVRDLVGNPMLGNENWTFTTVVAPDTTPPSVLSTTPADTATGAAIDSIITAVFSEQIDCSTVTASSFLLDNGATGTVNCSEGTVTYTPSSDLAYSTTYTATLTTAIQDMSTNPGANSLAANYDWSFTTETAPDLTGPSVNSTVPANLATDVHNDIIPMATFDEPLDCATVDASSFTLSGPSGAVAGNVGCSGDSTTFTPDSNLEFGVSYTATLTTAITDLAANPMAEYTWDFTTLVPPWLKQFGSSTYDHARAVALDQSTGDVYVAGVTLDALDGNTNAGGWDVFLTKYNAAGAKLWTEQLGTSMDDNIRDITVDGTGNVYLTGFSSGDIDGGSASNTIDTFLAKYDSSGTYQWARSVGTDYVDKAYGVVTDSSGNVYIAGYTNGDITGTTTAHGDADLFLIKYDSDGTQLLIHQFGITGNLFINGMDIDAAGNLYLVGETDGILPGYTKPPGSGEDAFIIKYNSDGVQQWAKQYDRYITSNKARAVAVDKANNVVYIAGTVQDSYGTLDIDLVKYDLDGNSLGSTTHGTDDVYDFTYGVAVDGNGDIYVAGYTDGGMDGNPSNGGQDMFLVKFDNTLTDVWSRLLGTSENDIGYGVAADNVGNAFVGGSTLGTLEYNVNSGLSDAFVVKYDQFGVRQ